jgi:hypothetical protein
MSPSSHPVEIRQYIFGWEVSRALPALYVCHNLIASSKQSSQYVCYNISACFGQLWQLFSRGINHQCHSSLVRPKPRGHNFHYPHSSISLSLQYASMSNHKETQTKTLRMLHLAQRSRDQQEIPHLPPLPRLARRKRTGHLHRHLLLRSILSPPSLLVPMVTSRTPRASKDSIGPALLVRGPLANPALRFPNSEIQRVDSRVESSGVSPPWLLLCTGPLMRPYRRNGTIQHERKRQGLPVQLRRLQSDRRQRSSMVLRAGTCTFAMP